MALDIVEFIGAAREHIRVGHPFYVVSVCTRLFFYDPINLYLVFKLFSLYAADILRPKCYKLIRCVQFTFWNHRQKRVDYVQMSVRTGIIVISYFVCEKHVICLSLLNGMF